MLPDGRQFIMTVGRERFRMLRVIKDKPYMVGLVEAGIEDQEVAPEEMPAQQEAEAKIWTMLQDVVRLSNKVNLKTKVNVSDDVRRFAPGQVAEGGEAERRSNFSFAVAEMFDISPVAKQLLLQVSERLQRVPSAVVFSLRSPRPSINFPQTQDVGERLSYQSKWLEKSRAYLAAQATIMDALAE
jgi:Lon protease-like protein